MIFRFSGAARELQREKKSSDVGVVRCDTIGGTLPRCPLCRTSPGHCSKICPQVSNMCFHEQQSVNICQHAFRPCPALHLLRFYEPPKLWSSSEAQKLGRACRLSALCSAPAFCFDGLSGQNRYWVNTIYFDMAGSCSADLRHRRSRSAASSCAGSVPKLSRELLRIYEQLPADRLQQDPPGSRSALWVPARSYAFICLHASRGSPKRRPGRVSPLPL